MTYIYIKFAYHVNEGKYNVTCNVEIVDNSEDFIVYFVFVVILYFRRIKETFVYFTVQLQMCFIDYLVQPIIWYRMGQSIIK